MKRKIELTLGDLRETQKIRNKITKNESQIRKLLTENHNLQSQLVRVCFGMNKTKGADGQ